MKQDTSKPQLHQSAMDMLFRCGEQYYRRYVLGEKIPPGIALIIGSATHKSIEKNLSSVIQGNGLLPLEQVYGVARDEFEGIWKGGIKLDRDEMVRGMKSVKGEAIDMTVALAGLHRTQLAPKLEPTHVERKFVIKLDGYPLDLAGTIDIQEGAKRIRDTKTAGKSPPQAEADTSIQVTMYGLAAKVIDGQAPEEFSLDALVKTKEPKVVSLQTTRTDADYQMLLRRVERATEIIEKGTFTPARTTDWWCSEKYCGYAPTCPFFSRRPVTIAMGS